MVSKRQRISSLYYDGQWICGFFFKVMEKRISRLKRFYISHDYQYYIMMMEMISLAVEVIWTDIVSFLLHSMLCV